MKISVGKDIRRRIITNLLSAHKQIADYGSAGIVDHANEVYFKSFGDNSMMISLSLGRKNMIVIPNTHQIKVSKTLHALKRDLFSSKPRYSSNFFGAKTTEFIQNTGLNVSNMRCRKIPSAS